MAAVGQLPGSAATMLNASVDVTEPITAKSTVSRIWISLDRMVNSHNAHILAINPKSITWSSAPFAPDHQAMAVQLQKSLHRNRRYQSARSVRFEKTCNPSGFKVSDTISPTCGRKCVSVTAWSRPLPNSTVTTARSPSIS
jgi:hypothetical protein